MKLIDVLLSLFDSFSTKIKGLLAVGTINDVTWYIYFVTPETHNIIDNLINNGLILCKRDINLFINCPYKLYEDTDILLPDDFIQELIFEVNHLSHQYSPFYFQSYSTHICKYLEINIELN